MEVFKLNRVALCVTYDSFERGYFVKGMGFDFFATQIRIGNVSYIECRDVCRYEDGEIMHLIIPLHGAKCLSIDLLESLIVGKLSEKWDL